MATQALLFDDLESGLRIRSLKQALTKPYIQVNPPHLRVWSVFDVDRPAGALAQDAQPCYPQRAATNKTNGHAHLVWGCVPLSWWMAWALGMRHCGISAPWNR